MRRLFVWRSERGKPTAVVGWNVQCEDQQCARQRFDRLPKVIAQLGMTEYLLHRVKLHRQRIAAGRPAAEQPIYSVTLFECGVVQGDGAAKITTSFQPLANPLDEPGQFRMSQRFPQPSQVEHEKGYPCSPFESTVAGVTVECSDGAALGRVGS